MFARRNEKGKPRTSYLSLQPLQSGHKRIEVMCGLFPRHAIAIGGFSDAGYHRRDFLLYNAMISSNRLLVVLKGNPKKLMFQLQRLRQSAELRGRRADCCGCGICHGGFSGGAVGNGIDLHRRKGRENQRRGFGEEILYCIGRKELRIKR